MTTTLTRRRLNHRSLELATMPMDLETSLSNQNRSNPLPERLERLGEDLVTFGPRLLTDSAMLADIAVRHGAIWYAIIPFLKINDD